MAYLGGKSKGADHIIEVLNRPQFNNFSYIEPFCGYCHILRRVVNKKDYIASDANKYLITLLKHIQKTKGEHPAITQKEYAELRKNPDKDSLRAAYAAFTYSYNGKFFGGYTARYDGRNYPKERKRYYDQLHDNETFHKTRLANVDYTHYLKVKGKLIYCDPPYANTTEYNTTFNSNKFWEDMRELSKYNFVFISEYTAPPDFVCIVSKQKRSSVAGRGATQRRVEKLFIHKSRAADVQMQVKKLKNRTRKN